MSKTATRIGIIAGIFLVLTSVAFIYVFVQIHSKEALLRDQVRTLAMHRAQQDTFFEMQKTADETIEDRATVEALFFQRGSDSVDFLNEVEGFGPAVGVTVETESVTEKIEKDSGLQWVVMSFSLAGAQADVERMITMLENMPYAVRVTSLTLTERSSTVWAADITLQVRLLSYEGT